MKIKFEELVALHLRVIHEGWAEASDEDVQREERLMGRLSSSGLASVCPTCYSEMAQNEEMHKSWQLAGCPDQPEQRKRLKNKGV
jgi:hypothetical protein